MEEGIIIETTEQIRTRELISRSQGEEVQEDDYMDRLKAKGVELNPKLFLSKFKLKNGLPYTGMAVKEEVKSGEILIRVPEEMILSSSKAFQEPELIDIFRNDPFFIADGDYDEDKIIIVYSMYLLEKKEQDNLWYQMIKHFPKECDIACFWSQEELDEFKDPTVKSAAEIDLAAFEKEWSDFLQLQKKYQILQSTEFNKENYKIIFIAVANRGFGSKVKYTSLVPLAEKINHHCSRVFYTLEKEKNQSWTDPQNQTKSQISSLGSCESQTYAQQGQFDYQDLQYCQFALQGEQDKQLIENEKARIEQQCERLNKMIDQEINWLDFSVLFVGHLILKIKVISHQYNCGRKPYERSLQELGLIERTMVSYKKKVTQYYQEVNRKPYINKKQKKPIIKTEPKVSKDYESLIMKTSQDDNVQPNNQIYFNYGNYSNRTLLLHYGFAIEGNKYQHIWLSFNIAQCVCDFPDVLEKVVAKKQSLFRKFKVYSHRLCLDMIIFFRLNNWVFWGEKAVEELFSVVSYEKEVAILEQIASILNNNIEAYDDQYDLTDPSLNYHQYFTAVYHLQRLHILQRQAKMISVLIEVVKKLEQGYQLEEATVDLTKAERKVLNPYLKSVVQ